MGHWFTFSRSKQRNKLEETTICVPRRQPDWIPCSEDSGRKPVDYDPASVIDSYFEAVMQDLVCKREDLTGGFFKGTHGKSGKRFIKANVGKNMLAQVGVEIAAELCLRAPETYTGHCWRRSAGTNASNSGVNVTTLMSIMGWSCPKTAMQYVKRSRITSLQMSMYLANVQRRNCSDIFPTGTRRASRKTQFKLPVSRVSVPTVPASSSAEDRFKDFSKQCLSSSVEKISDSTSLEDCEALEIQKFESEICTQDLLCDRDLDVDDVHAGVVASSSISKVSETPVVSCAATTSLPNVTSVTTPASLVSSSSLDLSTIDSRLMNVLQNLQNHGSIQIHFNFGDAKK